MDRGQWTSERGVVEVAVKTLTDSANTVTFLQEAAIMAQFRHPNILSLHGVVSTGNPVNIPTLHNTQYNLLMWLHNYTEDVSC